MCRLIFLLPLTLLFACAGSETSTTTTPKAITEKTYQTTGSIERMDPALDAIIPVDAKIEILAEGFTWSEGPLWVPELNSLLFSDVPQNKVWKWSEADSLQLYLEPSGMSDPNGISREPGANGLVLDSQGRLVLCQHGNRQIARMDAPLTAPAPKYITLVDKWEGKRFSSPNDLAFDGEGNLYFTDPPYGLMKMMEDTAKEIPFQGIYRLNTDGSLDLLTDTISRPNGIGLSPDGKVLYVGNSDPEKIWIIAYDIAEDGTLQNNRIFFNGNSFRGKPNEGGVPDGFVVSKKGHLFSSGPGGVWVFTAEGKPLGKIRTGQATSNCTLDPEEKNLYITAHKYLMRVKL